jgi:hypothetical protein
VGVRVEVIARLLPGSATMSNGRAYGL